MGYLTLLGLPLFSLFKRSHLLKRVFLLPLLGSLVIVACLIVSTLWHLPTEKIVLFNWFFLPLSLILGFKEFRTKKELRRQTFDWLLLGITLVLTVGFLVLVNRHVFSLLPGSKGNNDPWYYVIRARQYTHTLNPADPMAKYFHISFPPQTGAYVLAYFSSLFRLDPIFLFRPVLYVYYAFLFLSAYLLFRVIFGFKRLSALFLSLTAYFQPYQHYILLQGFFTNLNSSSYLLLTIGFLINYFLPRKNARAWVDLFLLFVLFAWFMLYSTVLPYLGLALPLYFIYLFREKLTLIWDRIVIKSLWLLLIVFGAIYLMSDSLLDILALVWMLTTKSNHFNAAETFYLPTKVIQALGFMPYANPFTNPSWRLSLLAEVVFALNLGLVLGFLGLLWRRKDKGQALVYGLLWFFLLSTWLIFRYGGLNPYMLFKHFSYVNVLYLLWNWPIVLYDQISSSYKGKWFGVLAGCGILTGVLLGFTEWRFARNYALEDAQLSRSDVVSYHAWQTVKGKTVLNALPGYWDKLWNTYFSYQGNQVKYIDFMNDYLAHVEAPHVGDKFDYVIYYKEPAFKGEQFAGSFRYSYYRGRGSYLLLPFQESMPETGIYENNWVHYWMKDGSCALIYNGQTAKSLTHLKISGSQKAGQAEIYLNYALLTQASVTPQKKLTLDFYSPLVEGANLLCVKTGIKCARLGENDARCASFALGLEK